MTAEHKALFVGDLDPRLKERLVADAEHSGSNMTQVAVGILAGHFRVPFTPTRRRTQPSPSKTDISLRMPLALWQRIHVEAMGGGSKSAVVQDVLRTHYQLEPLAAAA